MTFSPHYCDRWCNASYIGYLLALLLSSLKYMNMMNNCYYILLMHVRIILTTIITIAFFTIILCYLIPFIILIWMNIAQLLSWENPILYSYVTWKMWWQVSTMGLRQSAQSQVSQNTSPRLEQLLLSCSEPSISENQHLAVPTQESSWLILRCTNIRMTVTMVQKSVQQVKTLLQIALRVDN